MGVLLGMALMKFDVLPTIKEVFVDVGGADYVIENMEGMKDE
ncbi:uncharacterized protein METZ01_LOCUS88972 [marine metagenome]|uniref:Uncharacterized protein n=1 Tax=marine metagenome TaxID=408172 RepID=A0A381V8N6_9ZZZZ